MAVTKKKTKKKAAKKRAAKKECVISESLQKRLQEAADSRHWTVEQLITNKLRNIL